ncbi:MAG: hypothetical protein HZA89_04290 [Verrucomicrobia bacterium]|nr:hypothetical protein [Verrucomicrobiota bacterium]
MRAIRLNFCVAALLALAVVALRCAAAEPAIRVSDVTLFGDMDCFKVETPNATYLYGKRGAGFASILDRDGHDWISYRHGGRSAGEYRGLPKCGQPVKYFHCGYGFGQYTNGNWFTSNVTLRGPGHVRIHSETKNGEAACDWDFFPTHATLTLLKIPGNYWFIYEGTPGGALDTAEDFVIRPHGHRTPLSRPWVEAVPWVAFGAKESPHAFLLVDHQADGADASYAPWPYTPSAREPMPLMTVFGFGRPGWDDPKQHTPPLSRLPAKFSIRFTSATEAAAIEAEVKRIRTPATKTGAATISPRPAIAVWYGDEQHFGRLGVPQKWVNILGRVSSPGTLATLQYSLNGAAPVRLSVGADGYRLARQGDFNVDLDFDALRDGANTVDLIATVATVQRVERRVIVHCHRGNVWPLPYAVDWSKVRAITDAVQIVDGHWQLAADGVRILDPYYDRILAFGDRTWTDYTVTVAVTFHSYAPPLKGPPTHGVSHAAIAARFPGHFADQKQPHVQWYPLGAVAEFRLGEKLEQSSWRIFHGGSASKRASQAVEPQPRLVELGIRYRLKLRVDTLPGSAARYRVKSWKDGQPEPAAWDFETTEERDAIPAGGALVVSHNTDVTIGNLSVKPNDTEK